MVGLYKRAVTIRRHDQLLSLIRHNTNDNLSDFDISEKESEEILTEIDRVTSAPVLSATKGKLKYKTKKRGFVLPLIVNLSALLVIAGATLFFFSFFKQRESAAAAATQEWATTEGRLIERLKKESEQEISRKELQIAETRDRLTALEREREYFQVEMNNKIREREAELRSALESELELEMRQLLREGKTADEIEKALASLEREKEEEYTQAVSSLRLQAEQELNKKSAELDQMKEQYSGIIERQRREQERLRDAYGVEIAGLRDELSRREASLSRNSSLIEEQLAGLESQFRNRQLISDQISAFYQRIRGLLQKGDLDGASAQLDSLEKFLLEDNIASLPDMKERVSIELFIIDSFKELIEREREINGGDLRKRQDAFSEWIKQGDDQFVQRKYSQSLASYERALEFVKEDYAGIDRLAGRIAESGYNIGVNEKIERENEIAGPMVAEAGRLLESRQFADALNRYVAVVQGYPNSSLRNDALAGLQKSLKGLISGLEEDIKTAKETIERYQSADGGSPEGGRKLITERIEAVQKGFAGYSGYADEMGTGSREELYSLVEAELMMKKILNSEEIRMNHPKLYESVRKYNEEYGKEQWREGRNAAMRDVIEFMDMLNRLDNYSQSDLTRRAESLRFPGDAFDDFLNKLEALIQ